jgi:DNA-binding GntR family transcriptional regulator
VRLVLEPEAVRLATPAHDRDTLRKCELALIDAERLAHDEDPAELCLANRRFHGHIGNFLARVIENAPREATTKEESG